MVRITPMHVFLFHIVTSHPRDPLVTELKCSIRPEDCILRELNIAYCNLAKDCTLGCVKPLEVGLARGENPNLVECQFDKTLGTMGEYDMTMQAQLLQGEISYTGSPVRRHKSS